MKNIFKNIIGYEDIKKTLTRLIDVLNNKEKYERLGSTIPHGLFIYGEPGTGKTSFSNAILDNVTNRKKYTIRKTKSDGDFIKYIETTFTDAIKNQPSIILLDDLDKFAKNEKDSYNQEEYVVVQAQLDKIKEKDVFVIATVNNKKILPDSLLRSGRFDIKIRIDDPTEEDSLKIIDYYLNKKKIDNTVNINNISQILVGSSCADLEKVCNQAGLYAGFLNKEKIGMDELVRASLELKYDTNLEDLNKEDKYSLSVAYHEAGHALIGHLLEPGCISFITIAKNDSATNGMTIYHNNEYYYHDIDFMINRIKVLLAGKAATEIIYNKCDTGSGSDISRATEIAGRLIDDYAIYSFNSYVTRTSSNATKQNRDEGISMLLTKYYGEVKALLLSNKELLDAIAITLDKNKIMFEKEIEDIFNKKVEETSI